MSIDLYLTDRSGTIASGGTAQDVVTPAANGARKHLTFFNVSDTAMTLNIGADATNNASGGSFPVAAGAGLTWSDYNIPQGKISVYCATTGKAYTCKIA